MSKQSMFWLKVAEHLPVIFAAVMGLVFGIEIATWRAVWVFARDRATYCQGVVKHE